MNRRPVGQLYVESAVEHQKVILEARLELEQTKEAAVDPREVPLEARLEQRMLCMAFNEYNCSVCR